MCASNKLICWSWREELNLQPAVYKDQKSLNQQDQKQKASGRKANLDIDSSPVAILH